jgi:sec-independent protein translocase protein TatA
MADLGPAELIIIFLVIALVFGGSRLADLGGALGKSVREFRKAIQEDTPAETWSGLDRTSSVEIEQILCPECGLKNPPAARFCEECGVELQTSAGVSPEGDGFQSSLTESQGAGKQEQLP